MTQTLERSLPADPGPTPHRPRRRWGHRLVPVVLVLLGVIVVIYPVVATYYNNYKQAEFARQYGNQLQQVEPAILAEMLAAARDYNSSLSPQTLLDPWSAGPPSSSPEYQNYLTKLDRDRVMARLRIPGIKVDQPIFHGTADDALLNGVGHLYGTSLPVGGAGTHSVLTAHTGLTNASHFDRLVDMAAGDVFYIDVYGQTLAYQVDDIEIVLPDNFDSLGRADGADLVTLLTCTPYGINSHRLLVHAHRIDYIAELDVPGPTVLGFDWSIQPWMYPRIALAAVALVMLGAMSSGWIRSDRREKRDAAARAAGSSGGTNQPEELTGS